MIHTLTEHVSQWVQIRDADWDQPECCFNRTSLKGGTYQMTIAPVSLDGIDIAKLYRVQVDVHSALLPGSTLPIYQHCSHDDERNIALLVATLPDSSLRILSGPLPVHSLDGCASARLADSTIARLRLTYLDPQDLHHSKSSRIRRGPPGATYHLKMALAAKSYVEYRAYSPVLHQRVAIRLQGLGREKFEIRTLGRKGKVIKPFRYDGE
jgi:hypothetical protein